MIHLKKILIAIFCLSLNISGAGALDWDLADRNKDVAISVTDTRGNSLNGIKVYTSNLKNEYVAKKDMTGTYVIKNKCASFKATYKAGTSVKICASDSLHQFKTTCVNLKDKCSADIHMPLLPKSQYKYPSPDEVKKLAMTKSGGLIFYPVCTSFDVPNAVTPKCIKAFSETDTGYNEAAMLSKVYMRSRTGVNISDITCSKKWYSGPVSNDDYIRCTTNNGRYAYEFQFDDVTESSDSSVLDDTAKAVCNVIHFGEYDDRNCHKDTSPKTEAMCKNLKPDIERFSWTASFRDFWGKNIKGAKTEGMCLINFREADENYRLRTIKNAKGVSLDIHAFENIEIRSLASLEFLLHQYTKTQLGDIFHSFSCTSGFRIWNSPNGKKHLFECYATTSLGKFPIDFVFADLNVGGNLWSTGDTKSNAGEAGAFCIARGGSFDGSKCHGFTKEQCDAVAKEIPDGAKWDDRISQCVLTAAEKYQDQQALGDAIVKIAAVVGATVAIVVTGGAAAPLVLVIAATAIATEVTLTKLEQEMTNYADEFQTQFDICYNKRDEDGKFDTKKRIKCAKDILKDFGGRIPVYVNNGAFDDPQYTKSLADTLKKTLELFPNPDTDITEQDWESWKKHWNLQQLHANIETIAYKITKVTNMVANVALIFVAPANAANGTKLASGLSGFMKIENGVAKAISNSKTARTLARLYNLSKASPVKVAKTTVKVGDKVNTLVSTGVDTKNMVDSSKTLNNNIFPRQGYPNQIKASK